MVRSSPQTERLVETLELLGSGGGGRTLADLARTLGVDKATCRPMLMELVRVGWLVREPRSMTFHLGPRLVAIGRAAESAVDVVQLARWVLADLADQTGTSVLSVVRSGDELVVADVVPPVASTLRARRALGLRVGDHIALAPPLGASLAAWGDPPDVERWVSRARSNGDEPGLHAKLKADLEVVRSRGYVIEEYRPDPLELADVIERAAGPRHGSQRAAALLADQLCRLAAGVLLADIEPDADYWPVSINAPVLNQAGHAVLALCVVDPEAPVRGRRVAELGALVAAAAGRVSSRLQGRAEPGLPAGRLSDGRSSESSPA